MNSVILRSDFGVSSPRFLFRTDFFSAVTRPILKSQLITRQNDINLLSRRIRFPIWSWSGTT